MERDRDPAEAGIEAAMTLRHLDSELFMEEFKPLNHAIKLLDADHRDDALSSIEKQKDLVDRTVKIIVDSSYNKFNDSVRNFGKLFDHMTVTYERLSGLRGEVHDVRGLLTSRAENLRSLHLQTIEYQQKLNLLEKMETLFIAPAKLSSALKEMRFLDAVKILQQAVQDMFSDELMDMEILAELRMELLERKQFLEEFLVEEVQKQLYTWSWEAHEVEESGASVIATMGRSPNKYAAQHLHNLACAIVKLNRSTEAIGAFKDYVHEGISRTVRDMTEKYFRSRVALFDYKSEVDQYRFEGPLKAPMSRVKAATLKALLAPLYGILLKHDLLLKTFEDLGVSSHLYTLSYVWKTIQSVLQETFVEPSCRSSPPMSTATNYRAKPSQALLSRRRRSSGSGRRLSDGTRSSRSKMQIFRFEEETSKKRASYGVKASLSDLYHFQEAETRKALADETEDMSVYNICLLLPTMREFTNQVYLTFHPSLSPNEYDVVNYMDTVVGARAVKALEEDILAYTNEILADTEAFTKLHITEEFQETPSAADPCGERDGKPASTFTPSVSARNLVAILPQLYDLGAVLPNCWDNIIAILERAVLSWLGRLNSLLRLHMTETEIGKWMETSAASSRMVLLQRADPKHPLRLLFAEDFASAESTSTIMLRNNRDALAAEMNRIESELKKQYNHPLMAADLLALPESEMSVIFTGFSSLCWVTAKLDQFGMKMQKSIGELTKRPVSHQKSASATELRSAKQRCLNLAEECLFFMRYHLRMVGYACTLDILNDSSRVGHTNLEEKLFFSPLCYEVLKLKHALGQGSSRLRTLPSIVYHYIAGDVGDEFVSQILSSQICDNKGNPAIEKEKARILATSLDHLRTCLALAGPGPSKTYVGFNEEERGLAVLQL